ncbi:GNAT family N-acetyltransferase [Frankia sp. AgB1.9]|uniref:GNAT family N-acetyltransferase n=1 Tax=unclassified Frankia TaxID=2632575 RepID=UPI0019341917|nr:MULTISPECIES: GNAT family N-acetyltransferase [unclassified Frankia]MBL7486703.1 GNAT family N-acetyltransferase [Frankia sp. AgW1.1]MBL7553331.1 GNAT family N-acetyltransferase [Frankia sp. AgB1.9]MBL7624834.1 GNAT family N-acetyltransferase [Frankia sp. AgB1.8]
MDEATPPRTLADESRRGLARAREATAVEIRTLAPEERHAARRVFRTAMLFLGPLPTAESAEQAGGDAFAELDRRFGAFVEGELVGCVDSFASWLTVPGGRRVPHAAVTGVGVLATHTRRGLLTRLMRAQLEDAARRGDVVATLRASEATIYERFGYGVATQVGKLEVTRSRVRWRPTAPVGGPVRLVDPVDAWDLFARIHEEAAHQPGAIGRSRGWWNRHLRWVREATTAQLAVVHGEPGAEDGFALYEPVRTPDWHVDGNRAVRVTDFVAGTPAARAGLLRHLTGLDFVDRIEFLEMPLDDPLPAALTDSRAVRLTWAEDETWLRLLDVPAALAARTYTGPGRVTVEVGDPLLPANAGVYEISAAGATRVSTSTPADLRTGIAELGAVYLGGTRWWQLASAGRVEARNPAAVATADTLFATAALPYAATSF